MADVAFQVGGMLHRVSAADLATVQIYLQRVAPLIAAYASQYGPCALSTGPVLPQYVAQVPGQDYSDADLQGWVREVGQANQLPPSSALLILNPPGVVNRDAKESGGVGVLGYHAMTTLPYCFVNALGSGFGLGDRADAFAEAVSHEIAEMTVDPRADDSNPEVCDGCGTNCQGSGAFRAYFDTAGGYLGTTSTFPPPFAYALFLSAIVKPSAAADCPAPASACVYPPP